MINKLDMWGCRKPRLKRVGSFPLSSGKSDLSDLGQEVGGLPVGLGILPHHGPMGTEHVVIPALPGPPGRWRGTWENKCRTRSHSFYSRCPRPLWPSREPQLRGPQCAWPAVPKDTAAPQPGPELGVLVSRLFGQRRLQIPGALRHPTSSKLGMSETELLTSHSEPASPPVSASDSGPSTLLDLMPETQSSLDTLLHTVSPYIGASTRPSELCLPRIS